MVAYTPDGRAMLYLSRLPKEVPDAKWLVHNRVQPARRLGVRGFRAWLEDPNPARLEVCDCTWAPELGTHYREIGAGS